MFCPKCAAQNVDDAKFCRACGADISLVPQAVTGHLAERLTADAGGAKRHKHGAPSTETAVKQIFMGLAFVLVTVILSMTPMGRGWWFWMLIPSFALLGSGIGAYLRLREERNRLAPPAFAPAQPMSVGAPPRNSELPPRRTTGEVVQPPSVTEATTRHLSVPQERTPKDV